MAIKKISANLLGSNAVLAANIAGGAISAADIADNSITAAKLSTSTFAIDSLTVNTSDLVVDTANNRVGIGTDSPKTTLNLAANNSGQGAILTLENTDTSITSNDVIGQIDFYANDGSTNGTGAKVNIKGIATSTAGTITALTFGTADSASSTATERMRIDGSGNVGIGGTSSARLLVQKDGASTISIVSNDGGIASINFGDTSDISRGQIQYENNTEALTFSVNNLVEAMRIDSSGLVGIGTTSPVTGLQVAGQHISIDNGLSYQSFTNLGTRRSLLGVDSSDTITIGDTGFGKITILSSGNVGIGTSNPIEKLDVSGYEGISVNNNYVHMGSTVSGAMAIFGHNIKSDSATNTIKSANTGYHSSMVKMYYDQGITFHATSGTATAGDTFYDISGTTNELMRITNSGNVGIGTSSPTGAKLHVAGAVKATDLIAHDSTGINLQTDEGTKRLVVTDVGNITFPGQTSTFDGPGFTHYTNNYLYLRGGSAGLILSDDSGINTIQIIDGVGGYINFETSNGSSKMRIDSSGKVGIGTTSPSYLLDVAKDVGQTTPSIRVWNKNSNWAARAGIRFLTDISDSSGYPESEIGLYRGTSSAADAGMYFSTGTTTISEKMKITTGGNVGIGTTSPSNKLTVDAGTFAGYMAEFIQGGGGGGNHGPRIVSGSASSYAFIVRANASTVFYVDGSGNYYFSGSNQSDINKKENIADITDNALDLITQLEPKTYNFIGSDKDKAGFVAQDMENVIPLLVTGNEYDPEAGPNPDENPTGKGIDYMGYTAYLTKAIQELKTELDAAKARLDEAGL